MADDQGDLAWTVHGVRTVYDNRWVNVSLVDVQPPGGDRFEHHAVRLDRVAIALIVNRRDQILMSWRHRFVVDQWGYELLGGLLEPGEDPAVTAAREAEEESGWRPRGAPERLVRFQPLPGIIDAQVDVYLWRDADQVGKPSDPEEPGRLEWVDLNRIPDLVRRGQLLGAGTLVAVLHSLALRDH